MQTVKTPKHTNQALRCASRMLIIIGLTLCFGVVLGVQSNFRCDIDPASCPATLNCDMCGDCNVDCTKASACKGKTVVCPRDHSCVVDCRATDACTDMKIYLPDAPKAGAASCLKPGVTYAAFKGLCNGADSCTGMDATLRGGCSYANCGWVNCPGIKCKGAPTSSGCPKYSMRNATTVEAS